MLTYELKKAPGVPLYEALYRCIREDILSGKLQAGQKLPSKRALSENLQVSKITVEGAYSQLLAEGYISSQEKIGYFVETVDRLQPKEMPEPPVKTQEEDCIDLTGNGAAKFPFSVWSRLQREVMLDMGEKLLLPLDARGEPELRQAISYHLAQFRGMQVRPENIIVGAGTDFLYNLLIQLLGRDKVYGVEEPGYPKIRRIYQAGGAKCVSAVLDRQGIDPESLGETQVLHISPSHHFPTGRVTSLSRRQALLAWAKEREDRYIIEDDYDSEFRFDAHPLPAMEAMDTSGRVIYMNSFSKSLAPSIRISYMVLPERLMAKFRRELGFYGCTVPSFEQHTLARFLADGHFEKHINRMRKFYKARRNRMLEIIGSCPFAEKLTIMEENAGLHFLVKVDTEFSEEALLQQCSQAGLRLQSLGNFYDDPKIAPDRHCLIVNYAGLSDAQVEALPEKLKAIFQKRG